MLPQNSQAGPGEMVSRVKEVATRTLLPEFKSPSPSLPKMERENRRQVIVLTSTFTPTHTPSKHTHAK